MASAAAPAPASVRKRPEELEDGLNRFIYHPLAARLALLIRPTGLPPNAVSMLGILPVWAAAWAYAALAWPLGALTGLALHMLWHVVDGADGDLARMTGRSSATGEVVDGLCDYAGHILLYTVIAVLLDDSLGGWAWGLVALAGASRLVQSNHTETQRRTYLWWVYGVPWLKHARGGGDEMFRERTLFSFLFGRLTRFYLDVAGAVTPFAAEVDREIEAAAHDPARLEAIRETVRRGSRASLAFQKALGANPRTILLGLSMLAGSPLWYLLAETMVLNLLLVVSVRHANSSTRRLAKRLRELPIRSAAATR